MRGGGLRGGGLLLCAQFYMRAAGDEACLILDTRESRKRRTTLIGHTTVDREEGVEPRTTACIKHMGLPKEETLLVWIISGQ